MSSNAIPARREPATVRVAMWCSRHRWPVFALWFIGTIGLFSTLFLLFLKFVPAVAVTEVKELRHEMEHDNHGPAHAVGETHA